MGRKKAEDGDAPMDEAPGGDGGEKKSVRAYWKSLLNAHPAWLFQRSNTKLYEQYLLDHPDETEVPVKARQGLSTIKTQMRNEHKARKKERKAAEGTVPTPTTPKKAGRAGQALEELEGRIDDLLAETRALGQEGLERVIASLRTARNALIVMLDKG